MPLRVAALLVVVALGMSVSAEAQSVVPPCAVGSKAEFPQLVARLQEMAPLYVAVMDPSRQAEAPSITNNSVDLADSARPSDLATLSLNPAITTTNSRTPKSTDVSSSFSLSAIYAAIREQNPLTPEFFNLPLARALRRLSFSLTDSFPGNASSEVGQGSASYGAKYLLNSGKDPNSRESQLNLEGFFNCALQAPSYRQHLSSFLATVVTAKFQSLAQQNLPSPKDEAVGGHAESAQTREQRIATQNLANLNELLANTDAVYRPYLDAVVVYIVGDILSQSFSDQELRDAAQYLDAIIDAPKFALEFSARLSKGSQPNLYRTQFDYTQTFFRYLTNTANASFDFMNAQTSTAKNRNIARLAEQVQFPINFYHRDVTKEILKLTLGGEGDWGSNGTPIYKALGKITVSPFQGLDFPLAVNYVNRTGTVDRGDIRAQFGVAIDFTKLWVHSSKSLENAVSEAR